MGEFVTEGLAPLVLTLLAYEAGVFLQKKTRSPICNPIAVSALLMIGLLALTGSRIPDYQKGMDTVSWLLTPATVCLAIPMYEHFQTLRKDLRAVAAGVCCGAVGSLLMVLGSCLLAGIDRSLTISLLPKSVTTAIGATLSGLSGGASAITTAAIILTGILANIFSTFLFRLFRIEEPVARGVALGTAGHVVGTARANEIGPLVG
ncbi:MAG: LrgB family protein, partial [Clostridia bacterium]|nr:LrgB family protein [Clostridia bacterium]